MSELSLDVLPLLGVWAGNDVTAKAARPASRASDGSRRRYIMDPPQFRYYTGPAWAGARLSILPKIIRPAGVCSTLVTVIITSCPIDERPCSTTTIVPSSR